MVGTIDQWTIPTSNLLFEVTADAGDEILIPASNDLIEEVSAEKKEIRWRFRKVARRVKSEERRVKNSFALLIMF